MCRLVVLQIGEVCQEKGGDEQGVGDIADNDIPVRWLKALELLARTISPRSKGVSGLGGRPLRQTGSLCLCQQSQRSLRMRMTNDHSYYRH